MIKCALDVVSTTQIRSKILHIRNAKVILDRDLAKFYQVETRTLKQAVRRNKAYFPKDFMFQLSSDEINHLVSQSVIPSKSFFGGAKPFVFTESGVSMLAAIIKTPIAVQISIQIIRTFVMMRHLLTDNTSLLGRLYQLEEKQLISDKKLENLLKSLESNRFKFKQGIFYDNKVFDAHLLITNIIKTANKSIILIDNYVSEETFLLFSDRSRDISCLIYTSNITEKINLALKKFNYQYPAIILKKFNKSHDRFLIIDNKNVYHIGASLKDLGKKWFVISKLKINVDLLIGRIRVNRY
jgi:hypothetical protein